ncbi:MAG: hypothetical protein OWU84_01150 [Firmicutes bacterium]|nr:hypothetical protein [Bacillota bacterium]
MTLVRRLFLINTGWTLALYLASSFVGAWFWQIGTGMRPIVLFYAILFSVMVVAFAVSSRVRLPLSSAALLTLGILLNACYLFLLFLLKTASRHLVVLLAVLDGAAGSFYWLSLFVLAASWVPPQQVTWYNSWTGTLEAILGLAAPVLSGLVIRSFRGLAGYRVIFLTAFLALVAAAALAWVRTPQEARGRRLTPGPPLYAFSIPGWRRLLWSFLLLGLRDGVYFFVPGLMVYIVTHNALWLGVYNAVTAGVQGLGFWILTRSAAQRRTTAGLRVATGLALVGLVLWMVPLSAWTLMGLGVLISLSYPPFKVRLESAALIAISQHSRSEDDRARLTSVKEVWINVGRLASLCFFLLVLGLAPGPVPLLWIRDVLGGWALIALMLYAVLRGLVMPHEVAERLSMDGH